MWSAGDLRRNDAREDSRHTCVVIATRVQDKLVELLADGTFEDLVPLVADLGGLALILEGSDGKERAKTGADGHCYKDKVDDKTYEEAHDC